MMTGKSKSEKGQIKSRHLRIKLLWARRYFKKFLIEKTEYNGKPSSLSNHVMAKEVAKVLGEPEEVKGKKSARNYLILRYEVMKKKHPIRLRYNTPKESMYSGFYGTKKWLQLRYEAIIKYGQKCMACGRTPASGAILHVDHIKPRSKYPQLEYEIDNLQILCADCNLGKSNNDETDFRATES